MKKIRLLSITLLLFLFSMNVNAAAFLPEDNAWLASGIMDGDLSFKNNQISYESGSFENTLSFFSSDYNIIGTGYLNSFDTSVSNKFSLIMNDVTGLTRTLFGNIKNKLSYTSMFLSIGYMESTGQVNNTLLANVGDTSVGLFSGTFEDDVKISATPIPAAVWLFGSGLLGLLTLSNRKSKRVGIEYKKSL